MGIGASGSYEYGADVRTGLEVGGEGFADCYFGL